MNVFAVVIKKTIIDLVIKNIDRKINVTLRKHAGDQIVMKNARMENRD
jgi:hypothetical protein